MTKSISKRNSQIARDGLAIGVSPTTAHLTPQNIIAKKRRNDAPHTPEEIQWFIQQFMRGEVQDYHMSAWLMAICLNGMTDEETAALTESMVQSGETLDWSSLDDSFGDVSPHKVDKHSTGGVGDKISLILTPLVCSFDDILVPMMAGRGLGHTGGTIDKLESIPGFRTQYTASQFSELLLTPTDESDGAGGSDSRSRLRGAIVSPSETVCPADKRMYALRDVTATVTSLPLQTSSIMSKKIAERPDSLVLDVKFGVGSFNNSIEESTELAKSLIRTGELCGIQTTAMITRMDNPLGYAVGNWFEVKECIEIMKAGSLEDINELSKDVVDLVLALAGQMLLQAKKAESLKEGIAMARTNLTNGRAFAKFRQMVKAQEGDVSYIDNPDTYRKAKYSSVIRSPLSGHILSINSMELGLIGVLLGSGRRAIEEAVDFSSGIILHKTAGMKVEIGDILAEVHSDKEGAVEIESRRVLETFRFAKERSEMPPLIVGMVTKEGVADFDETVLR